MARGWLTWPLFCGPAQMNRALPRILLPIAANKNDIESYTVRTAWLGPGALHTLLTGDKPHNLAKLHPQRERLVQITTGSHTGPWSVHGAGVLPDSQQLEHVPSAPSPRQQVPLQCPPCPTAMHPLLPPSRPQPDGPQPAGGIDGC